MSIKTDRKTWVKHALLNKEINFCVVSMEFAVSELRQISCPFSTKQIFKFSSSVRVVVPETIGVELFIV